MKIINQSDVHGKKVLLRLDIDVPLRQAQGKPEVTEDFRLKAGLATLKLCIENASKIIIIGHLGRPFKTAEDEKNGNPTDLSAKPVADWYQKELGMDVFFAQTLEEASESDAKIVFLENTRFFHGEVPGAEYHATCISKTCDVDFAAKLASLGDIYVNEAFASHNKAASTTIVPTLLPSYAGLNFAKEVETLLRVREKPVKPFIAIMGGAKVADKLPVITELSRSADAVLVGGKLIHEIRAEQTEMPANVMVGKLNETGFDIAPETTSAWKGLIARAKMIVWNGPVGKSEDPINNQTKDIAEAIVESGAESILGGGDTITALSMYKITTDKFSFVSTGGGAMLKLLSEGTLPTIEALNGSKS